MLKQTEGFSLVELLITAVILIIALLFIFEVVVSQKKSVKAEYELIKMAQNTRASVDILLRELRMAGYKTLEADFVNSTVLSSLLRFLSQFCAPRTKYPKSSSENLNFPSLLV